MAVASLFYFLLFTLSLLTLVDASPSRWSPAIIRRATPPSAANSLHVSAPECDAAKYGGNLRMTGVMNALEKIPQDQSPVTFEMRSATEEPGWFVQLPHRVMSGKSLHPVIAIRQLLCSPSWALRPDAGSHSQPAA